MVKARVLRSVLVGSMLLAPAGHARPPRPDAAPAPLPAAPTPAPAAAGATELLRIAPTAGALRDLVAADGARVAFITTTEDRTTLHVVTLPAAGRATSEQTLELTAGESAPIALTLVGAAALVIGVDDAGQQRASLIALAPRGAVPAGGVLWTAGPVTRATVITRDGQPRLALHRAAPTATGGTRHELELLAVDTGKRVARGAPFELDAAGQHEKLELRVNHWSHGMTRAHGIKAGAWDRKENERMPDGEATYDLVAGKLVERRAITDLFEQRRRFQTLAEAGGETSFVRLARDRGAVQVWTAGAPRLVELDQPLAAYDPTSLQGVVAADGAGWVALRVDPVNPDALARKKADPVFTDVFRVPAAGPAVRVARVPTQRARHTLGAAGAGFWLIERPTSSSGAPTLIVYAAP